MQEDMNYMKKHVKSQISILIKDNKLKQAEDLVNEYFEIVKDDIEAYSMKAVILIRINELEKAEKVLLDAITIDKDSFDINYNLGYIYELKNKSKLSEKYYRKAYELTDIGEIKNEIDDTISNLGINETLDDYMVKDFEENNYNSIINELNEYVSKREYEKIMIVCDYWSKNVSENTGVIFYFKALAYNGLKNFEKALIYHERALDLDNSLADIRNQNSKYKYSYLEKKTECVGCESSEHEIVWIGNQSLSEDNKELINPIRVWVKCKKCGLIYANPQPEENILNKYYHIIAQEKFGGIYGDIGDRLEFLIDLANGRLSKIESYNKGKKTLLDIGAGIGTFVGTALDRGWNAVGLELTEEDCEYAKNNYGIEHLKSNFYSFDEELKYDVVTLFEVIEHLQKPLKDLKRINRLVKKGGLLVVATPIVDSLYGKSTKENNIFWNVVTHLSYFSKNVMIEYLGESGFEVLEINMSKEQLGRVEFYCRKIKEQ